eukprot:jgi/Mesvir1/28781/Mv09259-RA.1
MRAMEMKNVQREMENLLHINKLKDTVEERSRHCRLQEDKVEELTTRMEKLIEENKGLRSKLSQCIQRHFADIERLHALCLGSGETASALRELVRTELAALAGFLNTSFGVVMASIVDIEGNHRSMLQEMQAGHARELAERRAMLDSVVAELGQSTRRLTASEASTQAAQAQLEAVTRQEAALREKLACTEKEAWRLTGLVEERDASIRTLEEKVVGLEKAVASQEEARQNLEKEVHHQEARVERAGELMRKLRDRLEASTGQLGEARAQVALAEKTTGEQFAALGDSRALVADLLKTLAALRTQAAADQQRYAAMLADAGGREAVLLHEREELAGTLRDRSGELQEALEGCERIAGERDAKEAQVQEMYIEESRLKAQLWEAGSKTDMLHCQLRSAQAELDAGRHDAQEKAATRAVIDDQLAALVGLVEKLSVKVKGGEDILASVVDGMERMEQVVKASEEAWALTEGDLVRKFEEIAQLHAQLAAVMADANAAHQRVACLEQLASDTKRQLEDTARACCAAEERVCVLQAEVQGRDREMGELQGQLECALVAHEGDRLMMRGLEQALDAVRAELSSKEKAREAARGEWEERLATQEQASTLLQQQLADAFQALTASSDKRKQLQAVVEEGRGRLEEACTAQQAAEKEAAHLRPLKEKLAGARTQLADAAGALAAQEQRLERLQGEVGEKSEQLTITKDKLCVAEEELEAARAKLAAAVEETCAQQKQLACARSELKGERERRVAGEAAAVDMAAALERSKQALTEMRQQETAKQHAVADKEGELVAARVALRDAQRQAVEAHSTLAQERAEMALFRHQNKEWQIASARKDAELERHLQVLDGMRERAVAAEALLASKDAELEQNLPMLNDTHQQLLETQAELARKDSELQRHARALDDMRRQGLEAEAMLASKDAELEQDLEALGDMRQQLSDAQTALAQKEAELERHLQAQGGTHQQTAELEAAIARKHAEMEQLAKTLGEVSQQKVKLEAGLARRDAELRSLQLQLAGMSSEVDCKRECIEALEEAVQSLTRDLSAEAAAHRAAQQALQQEAAALGDAREQLDEARLELARATRRISYWETMARDAVASQSGEKFVEAAGESSAPFTAGLGGYTSQVAGRATLAIGASTAFANREPSTASDAAARATIGTKTVKKELQVDQRGMPSKGKPFVVRERNGASSAIRDKDGRARKEAAGRSPGGPPPVVVKREMPLVCMGIVKLEASSCPTAAAPICMDQTPSPVAFQREVDMAAQRKMPGKEDTSRAPGGCVVDAPDSGCAAKKRPRASPTVSAGSDGSMDILLIEI